VASCCFVKPWIAAAACARAMGISVDVIFFPFAVSAMRSALPSSFDRPRVTRLALSRLEIWRDRVEWSTTVISDRSRRILVLPKRDQDSPFRQRQAEFFQYGAENLGRLGARPVQEIGQEPAKNQFFLI
jgi:hypothetical protein